MNRVIALFFIQFFIFASDASAQRASSPNDKDTTAVPSIDEFIDVEVEPKALDKIGKLITYPETARLAALEGRVTVNALIGKDGTVEKVTIEMSDHDIFRRAAIEAFKKCRFSPAVSKGAPLRVWYTQSVSFKLQPPQEKVYDKAPKPIDDIRKLFFIPKGMDVSKEPDQIEALFIVSPKGDPSEIKIFGTENEKLLVAANLAITRMKFSPAVMKGNPITASYALPVMIR